MLHVLTGTAKGRKLKVPKGREIRPTTGRVKKAIFDTLGDISGIEALDIFAGSGGLGIEALSRGAAHVTFIEKNFCKLLVENVSLCGFFDRAALICAHYEEAIKRLRSGGEKFGLILIDPPYISYESKRVDDFVYQVSELLEDDGVIVIEHNYRMQNSLDGFVRKTKPFGGNQVSFFTRGV